MMYAEPLLWHDLMTRLADMVIVFLQAQINAGVDAIQLFDSWVGSLSPNDYAQYVQDHTRRIFAALAVNGVPMIHFGVNTATLLPMMTTDGASVIGADWRVPLDRAWEIIGHDRAIQGNLDPTVLLAPPAVIDREVADVMRRAGGRPGHIFNLGHGLLPTTPIAGIERAIEAVRMAHPPAE
jgi:uroporphyrinogen decarboxylase